LTQKVIKNLFAEVLFQIDQLLCKPRDLAGFDFWDFVLPKNGVICLVPRQLPHFLNPDFALDSVVRDQNVKKSRI